MYDILVIGAGPAGASAAIFSAKAGMKTLVIDNESGMTKRARIENHYGLMGVDGPDLIETGRKQAEQFGAEFIKEKAADIIELDDGGFEVTTDSGAKYLAKHIIIATGAAVMLAQEIGLTVISGTEPKIKFVIEVDEAGRTSTEGIWAAGVVAGLSVHTIITAGDGARVAINVISEIKGERYVDHDVLKS